MLMAAFSASLWDQEEAGRGGKAGQSARQDTEPERAVDPDWQNCYFGKRLLGC